MLFVPSSMAMESTTVAMDMWNWSVGVKTPPGHLLKLLVWLYNFLVDSLRVWGTWCLCPAPFPWSPTQWPWTCGFVQLAWKILLGIYWSGWYGCTTFWLLPYVFELWATCFVWHQCGSNVSSCFPTCLRNIQLRDISILFLANFLANFHAKLAIGSNTEAMTCGIDQLA